VADPQSGRNFDPSERGTFRILSLPKSSDAQTPHRRSDPCSYALLDVFRASPRGHPWLDAPSPRFGPKADRVRAAPQPAANAASSADPHFIGTLHLSAGQTLGHAAQIHRLPTPSRALCLETHQTRPCPRNHRPERVRTWSRLESGRTIAGRLTIPTSPPAPRVAVGIQSFATCQIGSARCCALQLPRWATSRGSCQLVCTCCRARMACASRLLCDNRSRRWQALALGVLPGCRAQLISPQAAGNLARDPPTDPRRSLSLPEPPRLATDARRGLGVQPLRTDSQPPEIRLSTY
jgi:hypothetical protein